MQEKDKNVSTERFLTNYGRKVLGGEDWYKKTDDTTDQRAPVNNPSELYEQFFLPDYDGVIDDLDSESLEDFDNDVYDYEDRSELGEDIAVAQSINLSKISKSSNKGQSSTKKEERKKPEDIDEVSPGEDE